MKSKAYKITILGAGSWGTALAIAFARHGLSTCLWGNEVAELQAMQQERCNTRYLPGIDFPELLTVEIDSNLAVTQAEIILIAVPSHAFREVMQLLAKIISPEQGIISATKGIDPVNNQLLHTLITEYCPAQAFAILSGPSFAKEVASGLPTAITLASENNDFSDTCFKLLHAEKFRIYRSRDIIGVQLCSAVKNVIAIATGISDGLGFGANARAALITRGLAEMVRLGQAMGAAPDTFNGLAGLGDLVLTCTDNQSRNRRFGLAIGQAANVADAEQMVGQVVEGKYAADQVCNLAKYYKVEMPIVERVRAVLHNEETASQAVMKLLTRPAKVE